jgi:plasmid stabilization system protein ParE
VEIIDYIEQRNEPAAQKLLETIVQAAQMLPFMPYLFGASLNPL